MGKGLRKGPGENRGKKFVPATPRGDVDVRKQLEGMFVLPKTVTRHPHRRLLAS